MTENQIGRLLADLGLGLQKIASNYLSARVLNLAGSGVELEFGFWIKDPERGSQNMRSDASVALLSKFRARGIEISFPQREVRLLQGNSAEQTRNSAGT